MRSVFWRTELRTQTGHYQFVRPPSWNSLHANISAFDQSSIFYFFLKFDSFNLAPRSRPTIKNYRMFSIAFHTWNSVGITLRMLKLAPKCTIVVIARQFWTTFQVFNFESKENSWKSHMSTVAISQCQVPNAVDGNPLNSKRIYRPAMPQTVIYRVHSTFSHFLYAPPSG